MQTGSVRLRGTLVWTFLGIAVTWTGPLAAQQDHFKAGTIQLLDESQTEELRNHLTNEDPAEWEWVLRDYLGVIYDSSLANLIVYLPDTGPARQSLIWKGQHRTWLHGQQNLWLIVVAEDPALPTTSENREELTVTLTSLAYQRDRFLVALLKGLSASLITGGVPDTDARVERETIVELRLEPVSVTETVKPLYITIHRFSLAENTSNRVSIRSASGEMFRVDRSIHYNFGNASGSSFGVGLAGGFTFNAAGDEFLGTEVVGRSADTRVSVYLFGHLHFRRPRLPWSRWSVGLAGGTNILRGSFLDDLVVGLSFGGIVGDLGVITGVNLLEYQELDQGIVKKSRKARLFVGVDFAL